MSQETEAFSKVFELEDWGNFLCNAFSVFSRSSCVQLFATPWMVAHQIPLSMGLFRQEYWRGLPFPSPGDLPQPGIEPVFPALAGKFSTTEPAGKLRRDLIIFTPLTTAHRPPPMTGLSQTQSELVESSGPWFPSTPVPFRITRPHLKVFLSCYHAFPRLNTLFSPATRT